MATSSSSSSQQQRQPSQDAQIAALVAAAASARAAATAQAVAMAQHAAQQFRGWYDTDAITAWSAKLAGQMESLQRVTAQTTDAYLARVLSLLTGRRVPPVGRIDVAGLRTGGVTHAGAYARAADVYRWQQSQFDQIARSLLTDTPQAPGIVSPIDAAVLRVANVAEADVQLASRGQAAANVADAADRGIATGYRRVVHPELAKSGHVCGLCIAASDRVYKTSELLPLHGGCHCEVLPITATNDPGQRLNAGDLGRLYEGAGGTHGRLLKATRYQIDEHGELGPVLNRAGKAMRTEQQAARDTNRRPRRPKTDAEKVADIRRIRAGLEEALPKVRDLAQQDSERWGGYLTQLEARLGDLFDQAA